MGCLLNYGLTSHLRFRRTSVRGIGGFKLIYICNARPQCGLRLVLKILRQP